MSDPNLPPGLLPLDLSGRRVAVSGPVCRLGQKTVDRRVITKLSLALDDGGVVPIMSMPEHRRSRPDETRLVGEVIGVVFTEDGTVEVDGIVDDEFAPPEGGSFACGIDAAVCEVTYDEYGVARLVVQLLGVTMYPPGTDVDPAFPDAYLRRTPAEELPEAEDP
ncbi:MAG TPA: hypothetical protein VMX12_00080 [Acidimicrobiia bacterium]|nr:hypothetical protein [Acidimicrobiia bacterium]